MNYTVKKLQPGETDLALELFIFFQEDDGDPVIYTPSFPYLEGLLAKDDFHVLVAMEDDRVLGGLTAYELPMYKEEITEMFLYEIGVHPAHRRRGVARDLIEELKIICRTKGNLEWVR